MTAENDLSSVLEENRILKRRLAEAEGRLREFNASSATGRIRQEEDRYRLIVESAVDHAIIATDLDGTVTDWNEAAEAITGWTAGQMVGRSIATMFSPEDVENEVHLREMRFSLTMGKARDERWHMRANGERFFGSGQMMPLFGDDEEPIGYVKILRDRTREEIDRRELEASRERLRFALDASDLVGTWDWDVATDTVYADSRFAAFFGIDKERAAAGLPFESYGAGIHPDDRERISAKVAALVAEGGEFAEEYRTIDTDGRTRWVFARGRCFLNATGRAYRFPGAIVDVTNERKREARQQALLQIDDASSRFGVDIDYNRRALEILGQTLRLDRCGYADIDEEERFATMGRSWTREGIAALTGTYDLTQFGNGLVEALREGHVTIANVEENPITGSGAAAWQSLGIASAVNMSVVENGRLRVILYLHDGRPRIWEPEDIELVREVLNRAWSFGQRRRAEQAVIEAETRLRLAHEAADIGTFDYDIRTGTLRWDRRCRACFGIFDDEPVTYENAFLPGLHPDDVEQTLAAVDIALDPKGPGVFNTVYRTIGREDGALRFVHASGQTVVEDGVTIRFVGAVRDVTEVKEAEERQQLLTRELQHRVKNTLAMVNALANQTLRRATNAQEGLAAFSARLIALSHAHDILTQTSWTSAPIGAIVAQSLGSHETDGARRLVWSGPDIRLNAKQSLALALALHELATNAAKYGALSNDDGHVSIHWRVEQGSPHRLVFEWRERGGPSVTAPTARGFGSRLIEQSLAAEFGGEVELRYEHEGLVCRIDAPMRDEGETALID